MEDLGHAAIIDVPHIVYSRDLGDNVHPIMFQQLNSIIKIHVFYFPILCFFIHGGVKITFQYVLNIIHFTQLS